MVISIDQNSRAVAKESYAGLFDTRNHIQDLAGRILTAVAFLTAAATAIFVQSVGHLGKDTGVWPRLFFGLYLLFATVGSMLLVGSMWPAIWNKVRGNDQRYIHTFSHPKNAVEYRDISTIPSQSTEEYQDELFKAYLRERDYILDDSEAMTELLRVGGIFLIAGFFSFLFLTSTIFFDEGCARWFFPAFGAAFLSGAMGLGSFIRHYYTSKLYSPKFDGWWWIWLVLASVMAIVTALNSPPMSCS